MKTATINRKTLHLTLKKNWFDMILSGEKKEEYREIKSYWMNRLMIFPYVEGVINPEQYIREFDTVTFKNGYAANAPEMEIELKRIEIKEGNPDWGAEAGVKYFVMSLGEILSTKNINH